MKHYLTSLALGAAAFVAATPAAALTVEDYCDIPTATPAGIKEMRRMADGTTYSAISDDGRRIEIFSYASGRKTGTLFDLDKVKGEVKIDSFDGYEISANGKKILLWNDKTQIYRHSFTAEYYVYDIMRSTLSRVSSGGKQRGAVISHDGRMVAYTRGNNVFISNLEYGTDRAITEDGEPNRIIYGVPDWGYEEEFGVLNTIHWSGDDQTLVFMKFDESKVPTYSFDAYRGYCDADPLGDPYPEQYRYKYPLAGYPNSVVGVLSYDLNNRTTKQLDLPIGESDYIPSIAFDGKGEQVMVMILNRDQNILRLFRVNPASTVSRLLLTEKSKAWLSTYAYQMVDYGENTFTIGSDRSGWRHLYEYDYNGTLKRQITKGDFNVTADYGANPKTGVRYVQTTSRGAINRNVASVDRQGNLRLLHDTDGWESASFSGDYSCYVRTYSSGTVPPQYTLWNTSGKKISDLELNKEYAAKYASAPKMEFMKVTNAAGEEMDAYIIRPVDFDASREYPLMMYQYNGPESQEVKNMWRMEGIFYIASQGYVVAAVDGRGTGNRSRAWCDAVYKQLGKYETADQIAGARHFGMLPYIDSERMACFGWSYGGYMTLMELTAANTPFKAGVSMAPVTDWRFYDSIYTERYMLTPQQNKAGYDSASALDRTEALGGHLLIMSGTSDDNVHFYNTLKYTSKLTSEGRLFDMMAYTAFEHSLRMCNARVQLFRKVVDFLNTRLK
ncbi:MAG: S9 family peptidase [Muribaculaceae bacterium]|nr:S9 family peptidase [Muribaculaceae bacterium]